MILQNVVYRLFLIFPVVFPFPAEQMAQKRIELHPDSIDRFILDPADFDPDNGNAVLLRHEPFGNKKEAVYERDIREDGTPVIRAASEQAISSVTSSIKADPQEFQYLQWEWKIDRVLQNGDLTRKDGDDFAARIYVTFDYPVSELPFGQKLKYRLYKTFTSFEIPCR